MSNEKIKHLLRKMTIREKVGQLNQHLYGWECYEKVDDEVYLSEKFKKHIEYFGSVGAIYGLLRADPWSEVNYQNGLTLEQSKQLIQMINQFIVEKGRHNILPFIVEEMPHGHQGLNAICYPVNLSMAATFNLELFGKQVVETSKYSESMGINIGLYSGLDIAKNSKWGRTEETFGADPCLASSFTGVTAQKGIEDHFRSCLKTFIAPGEPYLGLNSGAVCIGDRELNEIHMPTAKVAVENNIRMMMAAYNEIDGIPCHANKQLLTNKLRDEWGYQGVIMADGLALNRLASKNVSIEQAGLYALDAGVDLSLWDTVYLQLEQAINSGVVTEELLDRSVLRILNLKEEMNLLNGTYEMASDIKLQTDELNYQLACESVILQKNKNSYLPFNKEKKTLVIGELFDDIYTFLGDYTSFQVTDKYPNLKQTLNAKFKEIKFVTNDQFMHNNNIADEYEQIIVVGGGTSTREFGAKFADNGALLSNTKHTDSGENVDVESIGLPKPQQEIVDCLHSQEKAYAFLLIGGRPYALGEIFEGANAILTAYYNGQQGPQAISDIICGRVNPSGKNPMSIPKYAGYNQYEYNSKQDMRIEDFVNKQNKVFEFGHGLSYSQIEYDNLQVSSVDGDIKIVVKIHNRSERECLETVQLYVKKENTIITKRRRELIKFTKVAINSNSSYEHQFSVNKNDLLVYGLDQKFFFEGGNFEFIIGTGLKTYSSIELEIN
ncbi:MAG: glycoside hydrolase family 3 N-terminal domain-containing protein [Bacilli bacterium]